MWQVNPPLLQDTETLRNNNGTNSWFNFAGCWLVAVDTRVVPVAVFIQMLTIIFVAATASRFAVDIQLWMIRVRVATAIPTAVPLFTEDLQFILMQVHQGWLHFSLVAVVTQLSLMRRSNSYHGHGCTKCFALRIAVVTNPFGTSEGNVDEYNGEFRVSHTTLHGLVASRVVFFMCDSNARSCAIRA